MLRNSWNFFNGNIMREKRHYWKWLFQHCFSLSLSLSLWCMNFLNDKPRTKPKSFAGPKRQYLSFGVPMTILAKQPKTIGGPYLGSGPKGPMSCRTQRQILCTSLHLFIRLYVPHPWCCSLNNMENWQSANLPLNNMEVYKKVKKCQFPIE